VGAAPFPPHRGPAPQAFRTIALRAGLDTKVTTGTKPP
ncbi:MAG: hypothetical protein RLY86_2214, partial [Pseudomonadota bacterium]|jgi:hypothetical protein